MIFLCALAHAGPTLRHRSGICRDAAQVLYWISHLGGEATMTEESDKVESVSQSRYKEIVAELRDVWRRRSTVSSRSVTVL
jgi:hypothetical protein